jgi:putative transposase
MNAAEQLAPVVGTAPACTALAIPRASYYRRWSPLPAAAGAARRPRPARALSDAERQEVLEVLHWPRFVDKAPAEVYASLLDEGTYLCSVRTMYRILKAADEVRERRNQLRHPRYQKPELLATGPNQVWSWDITKLLGPAKWTYFYLYVILDIFSRYVVGWMVACREGADLAQRLIRETVDKQGVNRESLIIHSDRGPAMKSHGVAQLLAALGITKSHSRPHVSNDNPFSVSQFKTLKYRPDFPDRFGSQEHARSFCGPFFDWYNHEHYHTGIGLLTPAMVHYGLAEAVLARRRFVLDGVYAAHPERFVNKRPTPAELPREVWINPPAKAPKLLLLAQRQDPPAIETRAAFGRPVQEAELLRPCLTHANEAPGLLRPAHCGLGLNEQSLPSAMQADRNRGRQGGEREQSDPNRPDHEQDVCAGEESPHRQHFFRPQPPHPGLGGEDEKNAGRQSKRYTNYPLQVSQSR